MLPYLLVKKLTGCILMDASRRHETTKSETKDSFLLTAIALRVIALVLVTHTLFLRGNTKRDI